MADQLIIRGAREHNLKDVSLDLPRDSLIVFTGLSGSGKSSLAFDTIFAEGQRRYVESLSAYARQFLGQMDKPDVDFIEGLSPAVSIDQKSTSKNPRSTVGTITEVYDYLRLLYARAGRPHCPTCGEPIARQTPQQIVDRIMQLEEGTRFQVLAPVIRGRKGEYVDLFRQLQTQGFSRVRVDGETLPADRAAHARQAEEAHDRGRRRPARGQGQRQAPADRLGRDRARPRRRSGGLRLRRPAREGPGPRAAGSPSGWPAPTSTRSTPTSSSRGRSRSTPRSAPARSATASAPGWRSTRSWSSPTRPATLGEGVISALVRRPRRRLLPRGSSARSGEELGFDLDTPWEDLPAKAQQVDPRRSPDQGARPAPQPLRPRALLLHRLRGRPPLHRAPAPRGRVRHEPGALRGLHARGAVPGLRGHPAQAGVDRGHHRRAGTSPRSARCRSTRPPSSCATVELSARERQIAERVLKEIQERLRFLLDVGLDYLSLNRPAGSLSGGEAQRIRLATQIGAGLVGVLYVLDEPSIGLHQRDNHRLIETLVRLRDLGNTLIVVEHDEDTIRVADWVVDIGPGAGEHGGQVVHSGPVAGPAGAPGLRDRACTSPAASRSRCPTYAGRGRRVASSRSSAPRSTTSATSTCRSRSACSSRSPGSAARASRRWSTTSSTPRWPSRSTTPARCPGRHRRIEGLDHVDKVIHVDQSPIGRTPRSNPATYTGVFDHVRKLFAVDAGGEDARLPAGPVLVQRQGRALRGVLPATARSRSR